MTEAMPRDQAQWPQRTWALAALGALVGLAAYFLVLHRPAHQDMPLQGWRLALAMGLVVGSISFAFVVDRARLLPALIFGAFAVLIVGSAVYANYDENHVEGWRAWRIVCASMSVAVAAPLFYAWLEAGRPRRTIRAALAYPIIHDRAWMHLIMGVASAAFAGLSVALGYLLAQLFNLIGITALQHLMGKSWFTAMLVGAAFGGTTGMLRDREAIVSMLQRVLRIILSVLAPVLGLGLAVFVAALPMTGLKPLWDATQATTPILIAVIIVSFILANAAIGDSAEDETKARLVRIGTLALGATMLPLAVIAAVSTGLRIDQHGLSPNRLWALIFVVAVCAVSVAYAVALVRARKNWQHGLRQTNINLALGLCGLVALLSTPVVDLAGFSVRNQVSRLQSGTVTPATFSWSALRFDYGEAGRKALAMLKQSGKTPEIRTKAAATLAIKSDNAWLMDQDEQKAQNDEYLDKNLIILPAKIPLPAGLRAAVLDHASCTNGVQCMLRFEPRATEAILITRQCEDCTTEVRRFSTGTADWSDHIAAGGKDEAVDPADEEAKPATIPFSNAKVEIRDILQRQVFLNGEPVGEPFAAAKEGTKP